MDDTGLEEWTTSTEERYEVTPELPNGPAEAGARPTRPEILPQAFDSVPSEELRVASNTAHALARLLGDLVESAADRRETSGLQDESGAGTDSSRAVELRERLIEVTRVDVTSDDLQALAALADALAQKPSDLLIMVKLAEQADKIASVIHAYERATALLAQPA